MSEELYHVLIDTLEEESAPLELILNLVEQRGTRGPNGWKAIIKDAVGMSGARLVGLVKHVHNPDRVKKYSEVTQAIENGQGGLKNMKRRRRVRYLKSERSRR